MTNAIEINKEIAKMLNIDLDNGLITSIPIKLKGHDFPKVTVKKFDAELRKFTNTSYEIKSFEKKE